MPFVSSRQPASRGVNGACDDLQNALASGSFIVKVRAAISSADSGGFSVLTRKTIDS
jgi:hypothetical protein